ncbi:hypothetical protein ACFSQZ_13105, partial [Rubritalea spongiae]
IDEQRLEQVGGFRLIGMLWWAHAVRKIYKVYALRRRFLVDHLKKKACWIRARLGLNDFNGGHTSAQKKCHWVTHSSGTL